MVIKPKRTSVNYALPTSPSYLIQIVHKHLPHLVDRNRGIDSTVQPQFAHSVWQGSQVYGVGMGEQHSVDLMNMSGEEKKEHCSRFKSQKSGVV